MQTIEAGRKRMVALLEPLVQQDGLWPSPLEGVALMRATCSHPRSPVLYEPCLVFIARGRKRGYLGEQIHVYDPNNYLVLTAPLPFECATEAAADGAPLLGMVIRIDLGVVSELMMKMEVRPRSDGGMSSMAAAPMNPALSETLVRLLEALSVPMDCNVLGPQLVREIIYRVMAGEQGAALRTLLSMSGALAQIHRVMLHIHARYAEPMEVPALALDAGMSVSAFHHHFKVVTATSPLQYLKMIRLHKARQLMVQEAVGASVAAGRVGYESPSQFSREFKRLFGTSPVEEAERLRNQLAPRKSRPLAG